MPGPEAVAEVASGWLRRAQSDLVTARRALADRDLVDPLIACVDAEDAVRLAESVETAVLRAASSRGLREPT